MHLASEPQSGGCLEFPLEFMHWAAQISAFGTVRRIRAASQGTATVGVELPRLRGEVKRYHVAAAVVRTVSNNRLAPLRNSYSYR